MSIVQPHLGIATFVSRTNAGFAAELRRVDRNGDGRVSRSEAANLSREFRDDFTAVAQSRREVSIAPAVAAHERALAAGARRADTTQLHRIGSLFIEGRGKDGRLTSDEGDALPARYRDSFRSQMMELSLNWA